MLAVKAIYDGKAFIPLEKHFFKQKQQAIIVVADIDEKKNVGLARGIAAKYANPSLIEKENEIAALAFSGEN